MEYEKIHKACRGLQMTGLCFTPEEGENTSVHKREEKHCTVMNRFYDALARAAEEYALSCVSECALSRYSCVMEAEIRERDILVTVQLRHRLPGMPPRTKTIRHRWQDGLLTKEIFT